MAKGIDLADMRLLREEATLIQDLIARLKDQLNRLKIEEMQLQSNVRENDIKTITNSISETILPEAEVIKKEKLDNSREPVNTSELNLDVNFSNYIHDLPSAEEEEEEEEEDDDDDYHKDTNYTAMRSSKNSDIQEELTYFLN